MLDSKEFFSGKTDSHEPSTLDTVEAGAKIATPDWSEEERRNIAAVFTLLDQWDRTLNPDRQVA